MARPKSKSQLRRRAANRSQYDRVLIACEDKVATPNYLRDLAAHYVISSADFVIAKHLGSAPRSVVEAALSTFARDPEFDQVYCVFDRDAHPTYNEALSLIASNPLKRGKGAASNGKPVVFEAITSIPCFEFWLLLHFERTTAPMPSYADVLPRLRTKPGFTEYDKGSTKIFALTHNHLDTALLNAAHVNTAAAAANTDNPTTRMGDLIERLRAIRSP